MSIWDLYSREQRDEYVKFLQVYGALTNLFRQKQGDMIPYLDSKFQETVFAKIFNSQNVDIGNTPHDVLSIFGDMRVGIGLKTWMSSKPSFQKVMQLKRYQDEINQYKSDPYSLAYKISSIKNERMQSDYVRLGMSETNNIYHYVTRDEGRFVINESAYPLVNLGNLNNFNTSPTAFSWSDGHKDYKYTFGDSQIWQKFDNTKSDTLLLDQFDIKIIEDPFEFLLKAYLQLIDSSTVETKTSIIEAYLPLYSYETKEVGSKSGLNAWNAAPKNKGSATLRPLNEIYIPIPKAFHDKNPCFFTKDMLSIIDERKSTIGEANRPEVRFNIKLPNGKTIPGLVTGDNMKGFQSGSNILRDDNGKRYGQAALGQWLLVDVLGLKDRQIVTREWLAKKGTDSVRIWREEGDYMNIYIDFAPFGSFEAFMNNEPIPQKDDINQ